LPGQRRDPIDDQAQAQERPREKAHERVHEASRLRADGAAQDESVSPGPGVWLIDGYNVLHTVLLGGQIRTGDKAWRQASRERLIEQIRCFEALGPEPAEAPQPREKRPATAVIVFDGQRPALDDDEEAALRIVFAPSADDWIVRRVRHAARPSDFAVVSADRQLTGRCRHAGAQVVNPRDFMSRCPPPSP